jgi:hypothetical protein
MPFVQATPIGSGEYTTASATFPDDVTEGNQIIILGVSQFESPSLSTTQADEIDTTLRDGPFSDTTNSILARIASAVGGETTVEISGGGFVNFIAVEWSGLTYDATAGTGSNDSLADVTATTPGASESTSAVTFSVFAVRTGIGYELQEVPTGYTEIGRQTEDSNGQFIGAYKVETTDGARSATWVDPYAGFDDRTSIIFSFTEAGGGADFEVAADGGSFALTGGDAGLAFGRQVVAEGGSFAFSGGDAGLTFGRQVAAEGGTFAFNGGDAALAFNRSLSADGAQFAFTGGEAGLLHNRALTAEGGAFSFTGGDADLIYTPVGGYILAAEGAAFAFTGGAAALLLNRQISAEGGAFSFTGGDADFTLTGPSLQAEGGVFAFSGGPADLIYNRNSGEYDVQDGRTVDLAGGQSFEIAAGRIATFVR